MRIISQEGLQYYDLPYEETTLMILQTSEKKYSVMARNDSATNISMGDYSSEEKAKDVMARLLMSYSASKSSGISEFGITELSTLQNLFGISLGGIFRFPKDEDVEIEESEVSE